ncbi:hypothetical protein QJS66_12315 [Kocuria rhizophila]|nr:hypothetical protein QJS66_12315 [Kocuria rhizophila]
MMAVVEADRHAPTRPVLNAVAAGFELLNTALLLRGEGRAPERRSARRRRRRNLQSLSLGRPSTTMLGDLRGPSTPLSLASEIAWLLLPDGRDVPRAGVPVLIKLLEILDHSASTPRRGADPGQLTQRAATVGHGEVLEALRIGSACAWPPEGTAARGRAALGGAPTAHVKALVADRPRLGMAYGLARAAPGRAQGPWPTARAGCARTAPRPGHVVALRPHGPAWRLPARARCGGHSLRMHDAAHAHVARPSAPAPCAPVERMMGTAGPAPSTPWLVGLLLGPGGNACGRGRQWEPGPPQS